MPKAQITAVVISHIWDDESRTDTEVCRGEFEDQGPYVTLREDNQTVYLRPESWPEIRDQIQDMFDTIEVEAKPCESPEQTR